MSLKLKNEEKLSDGLERIIYTETEYAIEVIKKYKKEDPHFAVHEVRKSLKKIRASVRLVRSDLKNYSRRNKFYRDQARLISDIRDATAVIESLELLKEQYQDSLYKNAFQKVEKYLLKRRDKLSKNILEKKDVLNSIKETLEKDLEESKGHLKIDDEFDSVREGLRKVYKRGRSGFEKSMNSPATENFHEWRKRVKYLRYHLKILDRIWPPIMSEFEDELHELSDLLGQDHDLSILSDVMSHQYQAFNEKSDLSLFLGLINEQRKQLQYHSFHLGEKFYFEKPGHFTRRMRKYWKAHQETNNKKNLISLKELAY